MWAKWRDAAALYHAKVHVRRLMRKVERAKDLADVFKDAWRREIPTPQWDRWSKPSTPTISVDTTLNAAWEEQTDPTSTPVENIPESLCEAVDLLDDLIDDPVDREMFQTTDAQDVTTAFHHTLGRYLRNEWRLWEDGTPLRTWFLSHGLEHADDMSGIILAAWWHRLNDSDKFDFEWHVAAAKRYWEMMKPALEAKPGEVFNVELPYPIKLYGVHLGSGSDDGQN